MNSQQVFLTIRVKEKQQVDSLRKSQKNTFYIYDKYEPVHHICSHDLPFDAPVIIVFWEAVDALPMTLVKGGIFTMLRNIQFSGDC